MPKLAFKRGDRVKILDTAACPYTWVHKSVTDAEGIVTGTWGPGEIPDLPKHFYQVKSAGEGYWQSSFTADELEKV